MFLHYLANEETRKLHFSLKCCSALPEFNQVLDFFNPLDSRHILTLPYDSLNLIINAFSSGLLVAYGSWRKEVESGAAVGLCCMRNACAPMRCLHEIKKCHL